MTAQKQESMTEAYDRHGLLADFTLVGRKYILYWNKSTYKISGLSFDRECNEHVIHYYKVGVPKIRYKQSAFSFLHSYIIFGEMPKTPLFQEVQ